MNRFILLFFLSITNATSNNLRVNKKPKPECDKRSTRNAYRNAHGNGCIQTATLEWKKMRRKCIKVADDAAERAGDMVIDMADAEERRLSDKLIDEAATTLDKTLNDIQSNTDDAVAKLETDCLPENQIKSPPIPTQDCIDAETLILNDKAELENNKARKSNDHEMDRAVKLAENKKTQVLLSSDAQKLEARELVLNDCSKYIHN